jgi:hypothetical protein
MKRTKPRKRRDRRANFSPYYRFKKTPARYSPAYYDWRRTVAHNAAKREAAHAEAAKDRNEKRIRHDERQH